MKSLSFTQITALLVLSLLTSGNTNAEDISVSNADELRTAVASAKPGTRLLLSEGDYGGGFHFANLRGIKDQPIVIAAADPEKPPVFSDGSSGMHLSNPAYVELRHLVFARLASNGLNIDDGSSGVPESARGIVLKGLRVIDVGGDGNHDGVKLSGIWDFRVMDCTIERWGTRGGSAIDMVGCHRGLIEGNTIRHNDPSPPNCNGVQGKGGTTEIVIRRNHFENAGGRSVNLGGSTGLQFFRPALVEGEEHFEASQLRVEGNTFMGSIAPIAFVGVDGAVVRFNTIEKPGRWVIRILQETQAPDFIASRNGEFTDNTIVFNSSEWSEGGVNVGGGTAPETFKFARNWWYCADNPDRSEPRLPTPEIDGVYGREISEAEGIAGADALPK